MAAAAAAVHDDRDMTFAEKRKLSEMINALPPVADTRARPRRRACDGDARQDNLGMVVQIIQARRRRRRSRAAR